MQNIFAHTYQKLLLGLLEGDMLAEHLAVLLELDLALDLLLVLAGPVGLACRLILDLYE